MSELYNEFNNFIALNRVSNTKHNNERIPIKQKYCTLAAVESNVCLYCYYTQ